jgi:kynurenine formamidase
VQVLESLNVKIAKPIIVNIDNVGAIFVAENSSATKHTRHIDARYHFVREYIVDGEIKIIFVMSKKNLADMFTKNVSSEIYEEHIDHLLIHREVINVTSEELDNINYFDSGGVLDHNTKATRSTESISAADLRSSPFVSPNSAYT